MDEDGNLRNSGALKVGEKTLRRAKSVKFYCSFFEDGKDEEKVQQSYWKAITLGRKAYNKTIWRGRRSQNGKLLCQTAAPKIAMVDEKRKFFCENRTKNFPSSTVHFVLTNFIAGE